MEQFKTAYAEEVRKGKDTVRWNDVKRTMMAYGVMNRIKKEEHTNKKLYSVEDFIIANKPKKEKKNKFSSHFLSSKKKNKPKLDSITKITCMKNRI